MASDETTIPTLKKFISQNEIDEANRIRQAAWDRVRKVDDPIKRPEIEVGTKSLFERLKDQKDQKDAEWEEKRKFKNHIRGIDTDEYVFLENLANETQKRLRDIEWEEKDEIEHIKEMANTFVPSINQKDDDPIKRLDKLLNPCLTDSSCIKKDEVNELKSKNKKLKSLKKQVMHGEFKLIKGRDKLKVNANTNALSALSSIYPNGGDSSDNSNVETDLN